MAVDSKNILKVCVSGAFFYSTVVAHTGLVKNENEKVNKNVISNDSLLQKEINKRKGILNKFNERIGTIDVTCNYIISSKERERDQVKLKISKIEKEIEVLKNSGLEGLLGNNEINKIKENNYRFRKEVDNLQRKIQKLEDKISKGEDKIMIIQKDGIEGLNRAVEIEIRKNKISEYKRLIENLQYEINNVIPNKEKRLGYLWEEKKKKNLDLDDKEKESFEKKTKFAMDQIASLEEKLKKKTGTVKEREKIEKLINTIRNKQANIKKNLEVYINDIKKKIEIWYSKKQEGLRSQKISLQKKIIDLDNLIAVLLKEISIITTEGLKGLNNFKSKEKEQEILNNVRDNANDKKNDNADSKQEDNEEGKDEGFSWTSKNGIVTIKGSLVWKVTLEDSLRLQMQVLTM